MHQHASSRSGCGSSSWSRPSSRGVGASSRRSFPAWSDGPSVGFPDRACSLVSAASRPTANRHSSPHRSLWQHRSPCSRLRYPSVNQMVSSVLRSNRRPSSGANLAPGGVPGVLRHRQCQLVTHATSMQSPNSSLQRTPARGKYIAVRRPSAVGNVLATSAFGRTLGPLSSGR